MKRIRKR